MGQDRQPTIAGPYPSISQDTGNMGGSSDESSRYFNLVQQQMNQQNLPKSPLSQQFQGLLQGVNPSLFGNLLNTQQLGNSFLGYSNGGQNFSGGGTFNPPQNQPPPATGGPAGGRPGSFNQTGFSAANTGINNDQALSALQTAFPNQNAGSYAGQQGYNYQQNGAGPKPNYNYSNDPSGRPIVSWTDPAAADPNRQYTGYIANRGEGIPGGSADSIYSFTDIFGPDSFFNLLGQNPSATLGSLVDQGAVTPDQLRGSNIFSNFDSDSSWTNRLLNETSPYNIDFNAPPGTGARQDGYYDPDGTYHPRSTNNTNLVNGQYFFNGQNVGDIYNNPNGFDPNTGNPLQGPLYPNTGQIGPDGQPIPIGQGGQNGMGGSSGGLSIPQMIAANPQLSQLMNGGLNPQAIQTLLQGGQAPGVSNYNPSADLLASGLGGTPGLGGATQNALNNNQGVRADNALGMGNTSYYDAVSQILNNKFKQDNADLGEQFAGTGTGRGSGASLAQAQQRAQQTPQLAAALGNVRQQEVGNQLQQSGLNLQGVLGGQQNNNQLLSTLLGAQGQQGGLLAQLAGQAGNQNLGLQNLGSSNNLTQQGLNQQGANSLLGQQNTYQNNQNQATLGMNNLLSQLAQFNSGQYNQNNLTVGLANQAASQQNIQNQLQSWLALLGQSGSAAGSGVPGGGVNIQQPYPNQGGGFGSFLGGIGDLLNGIGAIRGSR